MSLLNFEKEKEKEFESIGFKNQQKHLRELKQVGVSHKARDIVRKALKPGKRISKTGKEYWETRKNRSDASGSKV